MTIKLNNYTMDIIKYINILFNTKLSNKYNNGQAGEEKACKYLKKDGYKIIEKNFGCKYGEIDIIAKDKDVLCFIEVKSRTSTYYGLPEEFVDKRKQQKLIKTSLVYTISKINKETDKRFDVVSVDLNSGKCRNIKNAFEVDF